MLGLDREGPADGQGVEVYTFFKFLYFSGYFWDWIRSEGVEV